MAALPTLYKRDAKGNINEWTIFIESGAYYVKEGIVGGKISQTQPYTCEAKNLGRANETTAEAQALREARSEWDKKQKRGYTQDKNSVDKVTFRKPMKGDTWKDRAGEVVFPVWIQDKLNGMRCQSDKDRCYSTGGETINTIPHIREALKPIFDVYPNAFIDGELFNFELRQHLNRLISLTSVVIKPSDLTPELLAESKQIVQFHVFDGYGFNGVTPEDPWIDRLEAVNHLVGSIASPFVRNMNVVACHNMTQLMQRLNENKNKGGEGLMVRWGATPFKHGRSKYMLKLKHMEDAEYDVIDIQEGNGTWKGCAKRVIVAVPTATGPEKFCAVNIDGDMEWLAKVLREKDTIIGKKKVTVEFPNLSEYGLPQQGWARAIRDYE